MNRFEDNRHLLVPMRVDALAVGTRLPDRDMFQWTDLAPDFFRLKERKYYFGNDLFGLFDEARGPGVGVHLHFRLPRAFTHGLQEGPRDEQEEPGDTSFPPIPNRWLVQRIVASMPGKPGEEQPIAGQCAYKAWLIKSDAKAPDEPPGTSWPKFSENGPVEVWKIGTCSALSALPGEEDEAALLRLTAVGQGNPAFSAYYPACRSVLGFHDPIGDDVPKEARLSYLVTGWYSAQVDDPLHSAAWRSKVVPKDAEAAFRVKEGIPEDKELTPEQHERLMLELQATWFQERGWKCDALKPREFDGKDLQAALGLASAAFGVPPQALEYETLAPAEHSPSKVRIRVVPPAQAGSRILCHGFVRGVTWHGADHAYIPVSGGEQARGRSAVFSLTTATHETAHRLSIGNTPAEALAALLASGDVEQDLLAALPADLIDQGVTAEQLRFELHERRFSGAHGGTTYDIQPVAEQNLRAGDPRSSAGVKPVLPDALRALLAELNDKQGDCDQIARELEDCRWQLYALWYLHTHALRSRRTATNQKIKDDLHAELPKLETQIETFKAMLGQQKDRWLEAKRQRDLVYRLDEAKATGTIVDELAQHHEQGPAPQGGPKYRLVPNSSPPFYKPNPPVIAVSGPAMAASYTAGGIDLVRLSTEVVTGIALQVPGGSKQEITGQALMDTLFIENSGTPKALSGIHAALLAESLLVDRECAQVIAGLASKLHQAELAKQVETLQDTRTEAAGQATAAGRPPGQSSTNDWDGNPWRPLFLVWKVSWRSDYQVAANQSARPDLVTGPWRLDRCGELVRSRTASSHDESPPEYHGHALVTPTASADLAERLKSLNESHPLIDKLSNMNAQLQALDGFNDALVLQSVGVQLPPLDFNKWLRSRGEHFEIDAIHSEFNAGFENARRDTFRTSPDSADAGFFPIRSGRMRIEQLSVVDAFGQTLKLPVSKINDPAEKGPKLLHVASSCAAGSSDHSGTISLPPRFTQATRLRFQLEGASRPGVTRDGPVCGWVLPNHMEKSLGIYDARGRPLGVLQRKLESRSGTEAFYWVEVPGEDRSHPLASDQAGAAAIENGHLRAFCLWACKLTAGEEGVFTALFNDSVASVDQRVPDEDPGVSVLVGRPLALVRASLVFELAGLPAHRPKLRADRGTEMSELLETHDWRKVKWPLRLGDSQARNDGLLGLFRCSKVGTSGEIASGGPFYPAWGHDGEDIAKDGVFARQDFSVDCVEPLQVTLLMDPQARVHATTGALPRAHLELPPEDVTGARRAREVFFQTAPILGLTSTPRMPRPSDDYGEWSWAYRPAVTHWAIDPNLVEATDRGGFTDTWPAIAEGWLKLEIALVKVLSFWVRDGTSEVAPGTPIHLSWSVQGAEKLRLVKVKDGQIVEFDPSHTYTPPFPREVIVTVTEDTTYRLIASAEETEADAKDLTVTVKQPDQHQKQATDPGR